MIIQINNSILANEKHDMLALTLQLYLWKAVWKIYATYAINFRQYKWNTYTDRFVGWFE
jgi:hypothetical protein